VGATLRDGWQHLHNARLMATFGMGFTMLFTLVGTFTYVNFHLAAPPFELNTAQLGSVFFVYLLGMVVTPWAGRYLDLYGFRKTVGLAFLLAGVGLALTLKPSLATIILGLALLANSVFISQAAATTHLGAVAGRAKSSAAGMYVTLYYIGGSFGAMLPGWFWLRGGWPATVAVLALAALATFILGLVASRPLIPSDSQFFEPPGGGLRFGDEDVRRKLEPGAQFSDLLQRELPLPCQKHRNCALRSELRD
jgi:MFS family permease